MKNLFVFALIGVGLFLILRKTGAAIINANPSLLPNGETTTGPTGDFTVNIGEVQGSTFMTAGTEGSGNGGGGTAYVAGTGKVASTSIATNWYSSKGGQVTPQ